MGKDRRLARIFEVLPDLAKSGAPVLLQGEPGTGKKLLAGAIHRLSGRASGPFFYVSCKQKAGEELTEEILGSNFDTEGDHPPEEKGILEKAHRGTIFLDGIEALPYSLQVSIFRAMEEGVYMPVGATTALNSDIRLIASTESDLEEKVKEGTFRENLFYCLNVFKIHVPPLRDRKEDIPLLARNIIWHLSLEEGKDVHEIDDAAIRLLQAHPFLDNITELTAILERAHRSARHASLKPEDLRPLMTAHGARTEESPVTAEGPGQRGKRRKAGHSRGIDAKPMEPPTSRPGIGDGSNHALAKDEANGDSVHAARGQRG